MASNTAILNDDVENDIQDAYIRSKTIGDVSNSENSYDRVVQRGTTIPEDVPFASIKTFYDQNKDTIKSTATGLAALTSEGRSIESAVSSFTETAKVMIKGLDALAQVHPAIGVAVLAFKLVVTFDMTRRENNKKVLALKIEMQDMMAILFELRHIRDPMEKGPDGSPLGARIQTLMDRIAKDIKEAGSACDAYLKKSFLARTMKSKIYEGKLAEYGAIFEDNKTQIEQTLTMHTARGVDAANEKLDAQSVAMDQMSNKVDQVLEIFRKLDSPRETEIQKFIDEHGGAKACIEDDSLLSRLVSKSGQELSDGGGRGNDLWTTRKVLLKEFQEDVGKMFEEHTVVFRGKLDIQSKQLETIQTLLTSGSHERIVDPNLKTIWKEMGWKGSVKGRDFVLALHDFFSDGSFLTGNEANTSPVHSVLPSTAPNVEDRWALNYINASYVQPILEAVDDDGTGFVSIKEVNTFVTDRPQTWTLLQRLAYWAAGWHISVSSYRSKIYTQVQKMFKLLDYLVPGNRGLMEGYLKSFPVVYLEQVLRSTKVVDSRTRRDPELAKLIDMYDKLEEERLEKNFASVGYELDGPETVALVTGTGRIERYIFPLLYVIMKRTVHVMMIACKTIIREEEVSYLEQSLWSIFQVVDERLERVAGILKQVHADVAMGLETFAFGMFQAYYKSISDPVLSDIANIDNSFFTWRTGTWEEDSVENIQHEIAAVPLTELKFGIIDLGYFVKGLSNPPTSQTPDESTLLGHWSGHFWYRRRDGCLASARSLTEMRIDTITTGKLSGVGQTLGGSFTVSGTLDEHNDISLFFDWPENAYNLQCAGKFLPDQQKLEMSWTSAFHAERGERNAKFSRTPTHLDRYHSELLNSQVTPARARWAFAREAVLHEVRRKSWSWTHFKARIGEVRRLMELTIRLRMSRWRITTRKPPLTSEERTELRYLRMYLEPSLTRLCEAMGEFHVNRVVTWHNGISCDACRCTIYETRLVCLVCVKKDFINSLDLCRQCMTASTRHGTLNHNPTHSMIKYETVVQNYSKLWSSWDVAVNAKDVLKIASATATKILTAEAQSGSSAPPDDVSNYAPVPSFLTCICCHKVATVPCWVCRFCSFSSIICSDCEEKRIVPEHSTHELDHPLIRIGTLEPDPPRPRDLDSEARITARLETLVQEQTTQQEKRIQELDEKVDQRLTGLETKVDLRLTEIEASCQSRRAFDSIRGEDGGTVRHPPEFVVSDGSACLIRFLTR